jgi:toxin ParE1/3/4
VRDQRHVILTPLAKRDLNQIWRYAAREYSELAADTIVGRITAALHVLAAAPRIGSVRSEYPGSPRGFPVRSHIVFYVPLEDTKGIAVWRILHGARDLRRLVRKPEEMK